MDSQEQTRILASLTDDELKQLREHIFGKRDDDGVDLGQPQPKNTNHVPSEGGNPDPPPISDEAYLREYVRDLFNRPESFYEQRLPE